MSHSCEGRNLRRRIAAGNCNSCNLQFPPLAYRFLPSQEWDGWANEIPAFAGMAVFYIFGYRQMRYCPQRQKVPPFRRKPESLCAKAQTADLSCGE
ncbi:MAG: hypothetical protein ACR2QC_07080 [Gammaproteobacteria bacterium]